MPTTLGTALSGALPLLTSSVTGDARGRPCAPPAGDLADDDPLGLAASRPRPRSALNPAACSARDGLVGVEPDHVGHRADVGRRRRLREARAPAGPASRGSCRRARSAPRPCRRTPSRASTALPFEPTQTAVATCRVYPQNHTFVLRSAVPVLPATGQAPIPAERARGGAATRDALEHGGDQVGDVRLQDALAVGFVLVELLVVAHDRLDRVRRAVHRRRWRAWRNPPPCRAARRPTDPVASDGHRRQLGRDAHLRWRPAARSRARCPGSAARTRR